MRILLLLGMIVGIAAAAPAAAQTAHWDAPIFGLGETATELGFGIDVGVDFDIGSDFVLRAGAAFGEPFGAREHTTLGIGFAVKSGGGDVH